MSEFDLGKVVMTRGIAESGISEEELSQLVTRHSSGDWGNLGIEDKVANDVAVVSSEERIFSKYIIDSESIYIITEWDRSVTTIMYASEY